MLNVNVVNDIIEVDEKDVTVIANRIYEDLLSYVQQSDLVMIMYSGGIYTDKYLQCTDNIAYDFVYGYCNEPTVIFISQSSINIINLRIKFINI